MDDQIFKELLEVIQSSNINFLLGSGVSTPFLPVLGSIETDLNNASDESAKIPLYKKYYKDVMLPNKEIIDSDLTTNENYQSTRAAYSSFFNELTSIILKRKSTILSKQINLFTTNIDILIETILEDIQVEYNDGFSGKLNPAFSIANYKKSIFQRSLHFEHTSEIPVFNLIKIHGSLTWLYNDTEDRIIFSKDLKHLDKETYNKDGSDFLGDYSKILVVNPQESKHLLSVLNVYYSELLRMYSSELEKENTSLFVLGFSMCDKHIREITIRAAKSNPTLRIFICCAKDEVEVMTKKMDNGLYPNIQIFSPTNDSNFFTITHFSEILVNKIA